MTHIDRIHRWSIYHRLLDLDIPCTCSMGQPLRVEVNHPSTAFQVWSVVRQITASRSDKIDWLNTCWRKSK
ncbi:MAG: hypothetical protein F6K30_12470 [Cyanothece sp. SIO2G6]|nr:hypothetical protein [Cyanothece sp. SIO2G6]